MAHGQILLLIAAFMLLSFVTLSVKNTMGTEDEVKYVAEASIYATSSAQAMLQVISLYQFDEKTIGKDVPVPDSLTAVGSLGKEAGEVFPNFDDIDDFKGYRRTISNPRLGNFRMDANVSYTDANGNASNIRTFYKKLTVTVSDSLALTLKSPIQVSTLISY